MPLSQRNLYSSEIYGHADLYEDTQSTDILGDTRISTTLGALHQIGFLNSYCFEIFDGLVTLSDDIHHRIGAASTRVEALVKNVERMEKEAEVDGVHSGQNGSELRLNYMSTRDAHIPDALSKATNSNSVQAAFAVCAPPPQLWKMDSVAKDDCSMYYSNPGFFFEEWLQAEQERQVARKAEQKKEKSAKAQLKIARRKKREVAMKKGSARKDNDKRASILDASSHGVKGEQIGDDNRGVSKSAKESSSLSTPSSSPSSGDGRKRKKEQQQKKKKKKDEKSTKDQNEIEKEMSGKKGIEASINAIDGDSRSDENQDRGTAVKEKVEKVGVGRGVPPAVGAGNGLFSLFGNVGGESPSTGKEPHHLTDDLDDKQPKSAGIFGRLFTGKDIIVTGGNGSSDSPFSGNLIESGGGEDSEPVLSARERAMKARAKASKTKKSKEDSNLLAEVDLVQDTNEAEAAVESEVGVGVEHDGEHLGTISEEFEQGSRSSRSLSAKVELAKTSYYKFRPSENNDDDDDDSSLSSSASSSSSSSASSSSSSSASSSLSSSSLSSSQDSSEQNTGSPPERRSPTNRRSDVARLSTVMQPPPPPPSRRGPPPPPSKSNTGSSRPQPPPAPAGDQNKSLPPPPPPVPARPRLGSALKADIGRAGLASLKKTGGPKQRASVSNRNAMLAGIKKGNTGLNKVRRPSEISPTDLPPKKKEQNAAISAILSNRAKIAGDSSSSDDDSDSEISF